MDEPKASACPERREVDLDGARTGRDRVVTFPAPGEDDAAIGDDLDATLKKANGLGAKTLLPPTQTGPVTVAMFADPEGNVIGIAKGM